MAPLELGSELARESFPKLGGGYSDPPVCDRGISALRRLDSIGHLGISVLPNEHVVPSRVAPVFVRPLLERGKGEPPSNTAHPRVARGASARRQLADEG